MKIKLILILSLTLSIGVSCKKVRTCECKTTWVDYTEFGAVNREEIMAYPIKDTKPNAKEACNVLATNQNAVNQGGYYTSCELKK